MQRREFLKAGVVAAAFAGQGLRSTPAAESTAVEKAVNIGVIGLGNRGTGLLRLLADIPGAKITALCDMGPDNLTRAVEIVRKAQGHEPATYGKSKEDYKDLLQRGDVDAVMIATPTKWHCPMAIEAMKAGKHVASEVPAGFGTEELWELVRTKEKTGRRYMLLENYLYSRASLAVWEMARQGVFGEPYFAKAAYLHDCRSMLFKKDGSLDWWGDWATKFYGSDYPTHAMGPVSKWLGINDGDRLSYCTCMMSRPRVLKEYTLKRFGPDSPQAGLTWALGEYIATTIMTEKGCLIRMDYDVNSPRPAEFPYVLQGTKGIYDSKYGIYIENLSEHEKWDSFPEYRSRYEHGYWRRHGAAAEKAGHGGGDYFVLRDFVQMARENREPWIDVYDAASWSVLFDCSRMSIDRKGGSVDIPDFTNGRWKDPEWRKDGLKPA